MPATKDTDLVRWAAWGGVAAPILFAGGVLVAATRYDGYSHVGQKISELGGVEASMPWIQNANFVVLGLLVIGLAWALARVMGAPHRGAILLGAFGGLAAIGNALLPCDAGCAGETTVGLLHIVTGLAGFLCAIAAMFVLARRWSSDPYWAGHARFTGIIRWAVIAGLAWFVATQALDAQALAGVAQRVFAVSLLAWVGVTAWRLTGATKPVALPEAAPVRVG